jgi:hypothetical protein
MKIDADKEHLFCQYQVAMIYENGIGTDHQCSKAELEFKKNLQL